jgi:hypothetical protein
MHVAETEDSAALGGGGGGHMASEKAGACAAELDDVADVASALAWPPASQEAVVRSLGMVGMADRRPLRATSCQGQIGRALISSGEGSFCQERCFRCLRDRSRGCERHRKEELNTTAARIHRTHSRGDATQIASELLSFFPSLCMPKTFCFDFLFSFYLKIGA